MLGNRDERDWDGVHNEDNEQPTWYLTVCNWGDVQPAWYATGMVCNWNSVQLGFYVTGMVCQGIQS